MHGKVRIIIDVDFGMIHPGGTDDELEQHKTTMLEQQLEKNIDHALEGGLLSNDCYIVEGSQYHIEMDAEDEAVAGGSSEEDGHPNRDPDINKYGLALRILTYNSCKDAAHTSGLELRIDTDDGKFKIRREGTYKNLLSTDSLESISGFITGYAYGRNDKIKRDREQRG